MIDWPIHQIFGSSMKKGSILLSNCFHNVVGVTLVTEEPTSWSWLSSTATTTRSCFRSCFIIGAAHHVYAPLFNVLAATLWASFEPWTGGIFLCGWFIIIDSVPGGNSCLLRDVWPRWRVRTCRDTSLGHLQNIVLPELFSRVTICCNLQAPWKKCSYSSSMPLPYCLNLPVLS